MAFFVVGLAGMAIRSIRRHERKSKQDEDAQYYGQQAVGPAAYGYAPAKATYNPNYDHSYYPRKQRSGCCQRKAERRYRRQMRREDRMARRAERWAPAPVVERYPAGPVVEREAYTPETASVRDEPPSYEELERESKTKS